MLGLVFVTQVFYMLRLSDLQIFIFSDLKTEQLMRMANSVVTSKRQSRDVFVGFFTILIHLLMLWSTEIYGNHVHLYKELCTYHQDQSTDVSSVFLAFAITASNLDLAVLLSMVTTCTSHLHQSY